MSTNQVRSLSLLWPWSGDSFKSGKNSRFARHGPISHILSHTPVRYRYRAFSLTSLSITSSQNGGHFGVQMQLA